MQDDGTFTRNGANVVLESRKGETCSVVLGQRVQKHRCCCQRALEHFFGHEMGSFGPSYDSVECPFVCPGSGCPAPNWCRSAWTRNWTRRRCWRAGSPTSASRCRSPTTALCSTAARCRETPAARPATVTEHSSWEQAWILHLLHQTPEFIPVAQSGKHPPHLPQDTHSCTLGRI